jgi:hypothetical protein
MLQVVSLVEGENLETVLLLFLLDPADGCICGSMQRGHLLD